MPIELSQGFRFGAFTAEPLKGSVAGDDGQSHHLAPKAMDVLVRLAEAAPKPVTREDLITAVWGERYVSDEVLTHAIKELRHALGNSPTRPRYIQTIPKRGYRLLRKARPIAEPTPARDGRKRRYLVIAASLVLVFVACGWLVVNLTPNTEPTEAASEADEVTVTGITVNPSPRIAVLPFADLSPDGDQEYFSDGISEEILNLLAQIESLKVIARHSAFSFKGQNVDIATIAAKLDVSYVVEGSVRRSGDRVRITAQLIDATDSSHLWSEAYDRDYSAENLIEIQCEIARAITGQLRMALTGDDEVRLAKVPTENTEAYTAYLLGRERLRDRKVAELRDAVDQFARAVELDPQFAHAYAGLADACWLYWQFSRGHVSEHCPFADGEEEGSAKIDDLEPLVRKALSIDEEVGEAWVTLGIILREKAYSQGGGPDVMWLIREAQAALRKGIDLSPSFGQAYYWYARSLVFIYSYDDPPNGWLTAWENRHWQSVVERGLEVNPLSLSLHGFKTSYPGFSSTREEAVAHAQRMIEIAPDSPQGYAKMAAIQAYNYGRLDEAILWWKQAAKRDSERSGYKLAIAESYCALGDAGMARAYAHQATQLLPPDQRTADFGVLIIEACDLLLSGDVYSGRLGEVLQEIGDNSSEWYLNLRAMIDIAAGRAEDALARYKAYDPETCFDDNGDYGELCHFQVMRVLQAAGDNERARRFAEKQLKFAQPWFDRYPAYWSSLSYAQGLVFFGRTEEALDVLEALVASGWRGWAWAWFTLEYDIAFDSIRDHPRFQTLIAAIRADFAQQLENVRAMERRGELPTRQEVQEGLIANSD